MLKIINEAYNDVLALYKNIIHWTISKMIITTGTVVFAAIFSFILILIFSLLNGSLLLENYGKMLHGIDFHNIIPNIALLYQNIGMQVFSIFTLDILNLIYFIAGLGFIFIISYSYILLGRLNLEYLKGKELKYSKNEYFNFKLFFRYIGLNYMNLLVLLIPSIIFTIFAFLLAISYGGIGDLNRLFSIEEINAFSILLLLLAVIFVIITIYLFYRIVYSYIILIEDKKHKKSVFETIKESFKITKGYKKFFKTVVVFGLFSFILLPFIFVGNSIATKSEEQKSYYKFLEKTEEEREDIRFYHLQQTYGKLTKEELLGNISSLGNYMVIFTIIKFLAVAGLLNLLYVSTYKRIITKK